MRWDVGEDFSGGRLHCMSDPSAEGDRNRMNSALYQQPSNTADKPVGNALMMHGANCSEPMSIRKIMTIRNYSGTVRAVLESNFRIR